MTNERTEKPIQGWRRPKRRRYSLIRKVRPIVSSPRDYSSVSRRCDAPCACRRRCVADLAKCLRPAAVRGCDENKVDETLTELEPFKDSERSRVDPMLPAAGADDEGGGI